MAPKRRIATKVSSKKKVKTESEPCYTVSKYCIPEKCLQNIKIGERVTSISDTVYSACLDDECKYVVKLFPIAPNDLDAENKRMEMEKDIEMSQKAGETEYAPKVKRIIRDCKTKLGRKNINMTMMIMERFDTSLNDLLQTHPELKKSKKFINSLKKELSKAVNAIAEKSIDHGDLHEGNILLNITKDGDIDRLVLSDYGRSFVTDPIIAKVVMMEVYIRLLIWILYFDNIG